MTAFPVVIGDEQGLVPGVKAGPEEVSWHPHPASTGPWAVGGQLCQRFFLRGFEFCPSGLHPPCLAHGKQPPGFLGATQV